MPGPLLALLLALLPLASAASPAPPLVAADPYSLAKAKLAAAESSLAAANAAIPDPARRQSAGKLLDEALTALEEGFATLPSGAAAGTASAEAASLRARFASLREGLAAARDHLTRLEVDRLLAEARRSYDLSNLDAAWDSLSKANALWRSNYPDLAHPALEFWTNLVRMARDTGTTRAIARSDPLYNEMTQYLSLARMKYDDGMALRKAGKETEARRSFDEALSLAANVTRTFPLNADAGFLTLQVLKATNEADFRASLPNRVEEAAALLARDPAAGYARVSDLARLEPTDPRLQKLLIQAEIATGKRRPEPSAAERSRSQQLADEARQLVKTGKKTDLASATQRLAEALRLDPDNKDAQNLSLNIQILQGTAPDRQLGTEDQKRLNEASLLYTQGQYNLSRASLIPLLAEGATRTREVLLLDARLNELGY